MEIIVNKELRKKLEKPGLTKEYLEECKATNEKYKHREETTQTGTLLTLIKENPTLKIIPMVSSGCLTNANFNYCMSSWGKASLDEYFISDKKVYLKSVDNEKIVKEYMETIGKGYHTLPTNEKLKGMAQSMVNNLNWTKAIIVHIDAID